MEKCCKGDKRHTSLVGKVADDPSAAKKTGKKSRERVSLGESHLVDRKVSDPNVAERIGKKKTLQYFRKEKLQKTIAPVEVKKEKRNGGWICLSIAVDSGACDSVISPKDIPQYAECIKETEESLKGEGFVSATGEGIPNYGEVTLPIITRERSFKGLTFQAAGVAKPLLSAEKLNQAGKLVVFDGDNSCIIDKATGEVNMLRREEGNFMLDVWVPPLTVSQQLGFQGRP